MAKQIGDYYLGLDIGTNSVGWAITDPQYNILECRGKATWGIHLFEEGKTAEERRSHRCARRRLNRRKQRITLLRELLSEEIFKVDPGFFDRLDESSLHLDDRKTKQLNSLFNDPNFTDADYHSKFPTIYHLRKDLMETEEKPDLRLIYLALHHIVKYRGHFLFSGLTDHETLPSFESLFDSIKDNLYQYDLDASIPDSKLLSDVLTDRNLNISEKKYRLKSIFTSDLCDNKQQMSEFITILSGGNTKLSVLFNDESIEGVKVSFKNSDADEEILQLEDVLNDDQIVTVRLLKQIYDWSVLTSILTGFQSISYSMIASYDQHKEDLKSLKKAVRRFNPEAYNEIFKSPETSGNYPSYSGMCSKPIMKRCNREEFCKYCLNKLGDKFESDPEYATMCSRLKDCSFMPKQRTSDNSIIPYNVHLQELRRIISNVSRWYPFLSETNDDGFSISEKIEMIQCFRVPYFVGPLNPHSPYAWAIRSTNEKVLPWNIEKVMNYDASADVFITRMTNFCAYLIGEKVLPKNSILYSYFMLYNELNNLKIDGNTISVSLKRRIVKDLFEESDKKVTKKRLLTYLKTIGEIDNTESHEIKGIDEDVKSSLKPVHLLRSIIGDKINNRKMAESIIRTITVFEEPKRIEYILSRDYEKDLLPAEIKKLSKLTFSGWGRLSEKFLTGLFDTCRETGTTTNIMGMLESTQDNLMEIIHKYSFLKQASDLNMQNASAGGVEYTDLDKMSLPPAVKHGVWRSISVVKDLVDCIGHDPKKVFVETTRENLDPKKKIRTESRKLKLDALYKKCNEDAEWIASLSTQTDESLKSRRLFLYYTQLGKCMYCGRKIDIAELGNTDSVDLDHIYPQSKVVDDSIHNNMVLSCKKCNGDKSNAYPISLEVQHKMRKTWDQLRSKDYITAEKYSRLIRTDSFSDDELNRFINRQVVETSQAVKGTITILKRLMPDSDIVYVKAGMVSDFRHEMGFIKCREINDYHHAKDAYLNIVVGNVYDVKFTKDVAHFIHTKEQYNLKRMFEHPVSRNGTDAWIPGDNGSEKTVKKYMRRDNILFVRSPFIQKGELFDAQLMKKSDTLYPKKKGLSASEYGGYNKLTGACYSLVEYERKKKIVRSLEVVPVMDVKLLSDPSVLSAYFSERLSSDVKVIIPLIRMNSLIEWEGYPLHIGGRSGDTIVYVNALQLLVPDEVYEYSKILSKYSKDQKERTYHSASYYKITKEKNVSMFNYFVDKTFNLPYSKWFTALNSNLCKCKERFETSDELTQAAVLIEIIHSFQCKPIYTDLKKIGGVGLTGRIQIGKVLPSGVDISLVNQSPSGLKTNKMRLSL